MFLLPEGAFCQGRRSQTIAKILRQQGKAWYKNIIHSKGQDGAILRALIFLRFEENARPKAPQRKSSIAGCFDVQPSFKNKYKNWQL